MLKFPKSENEWIVALLSALSGFFFGGAAIAATQTFLQKAFGIKA